MIPVVSKRIKEIRTNILHLSQKEFSTIMGVSSPTFNQFESGKHGIKMPSILKVINFAKDQGFRISLDYLYGLTDDILNLTHEENKVIEKQKVELEEVRAQNMKLVDKLLDETKGN